MNLTKEEWLNTKPHHHVFLSPIRSSMKAQIFNEPETIEDSIQVKMTKEDILKDGRSKENIIKLVNAYNQQMRYREAIIELEAGLKEYKDDYELIRLLAQRELTICNYSKAKELFLNLLPRTNDLLDIYYRLGLCDFYLGEYESSKEYMKKSLDLSSNDPDMYIASLYWLIFSYVELNENPEEVLRLYKPLFTLHHAGYEYAIRLFLGDSIKEYEKISNSDNLTRIMYLFGKYEYYKYKHNFKLAEKTLLDCEKSDEFFGSYSYIAVLSKTIKR